MEGVEVRGEECQGGGCGGEGGGVPRWRVWVYVILPRCYVVRAISDDVISCYNVPGIVTVQQHMMCAYMYITVQPTEKGRGS